MELFHFIHASDFIVEPGKCQAVLQVQIAALVYLAAPENPAAALESTYTLRALLSKLVASSMAH